MIGYLRHLAHFAQIVDAGSMTGAAHKLGTSPSAMSESVRILEAYFGEPLLERSKRGVAVTGRGMTLYEHCRHIVDGMEGALGQRAAGLSGTVKISAPSELLGNGFAPAIAHLGHDAPEIRLVLAAENEVLDHTRFGRDLYVRAGKRDKRQGLQVLHEGSDRAVLVATPALAKTCNPEDARSVETLPFLTSVSAASHAKLGTTDGQLRFRKTVQVGAIDARLALMREGAGAVACLLSSVRKDIAAGRVVRLMPGPFNWEVACVIASPHRAPSEAVRHVAQTLAQVWDQESEGK
ncbi:LysR family transcriptional regulator [Roseobacteraceae bacterium S113]